MYNSHNKGLAVCGIGFLERNDLLLYSLYIAGLHVSER